MPGVCWTYTVAAKAGGQTQARLRAPHRGVITVVGMQRGKKAVSLTEAAIVVALVSMLALAAARVFTTSKTTVSADLARVVLQSVASQQEELYRQRGAWVTSPSALERRFEDIEFTTNATVEREVSIVAKTLDDGTAVLGLATLSHAGECITLVLYEPGRGDGSFGGFEPSPVRPCSGSEAR